MEVEDEVYLGKHRTAMGTRMRVHVRYTPELYPVLSVWSTK